MHFQASPYLGLKICVMNELSEQREGMTKTEEMGEEGERCRANMMDVMYMFEQPVTHG